MILASGSPRRADLLSRILDRFVVIPSGADEAFDGPPEQGALGVARAKAREVARNRRGIIIGADTIVVTEGRILGKPGSAAEARDMLQRLSGREHDVITGLCVLRTDPSVERTAVECTTVRFRALLPNEIDSYITSGEYVDKAGAYGIQGRAAMFVDRICGDYYNVMGLPLCRLALLLREVGVGV